MINYFYGNNAVDSFDSTIFKDFDINEDNTFIDDGFKKASNMEYSQLKKLLNSQTTLFIVNTSHLGKTKREIKNQIAWLINHNIPFVVMNIPDTLNPNIRLQTNKQIYSTSLKEAEVEQINVKKAQAQGIQNAKKTGKKMGRTKIHYPNNWEELYNQWSNKAITAVEFMNKANLKKGTFYNLLKEYKLNHK